ncbi:ClpP/crotonase-like domain-containing protein [Tribonema minus]|uniref:ATP-dependent Clp protease proteolytic subunit n=1 Tax=Tribonema minus TaxID=303371 RepID=A0A835Z7A8_9STRA|nr:ClpP/crotonase-like domain-containing protein [Tribonema minus]
MVSTRLIALLACPAVACTNAFVMTLFPRMSRIALIRYGGASLVGNAIVATTSPSKASADDSDFGGQAMIKRTNNRIYFYSEVTTESCAALRRFIGEATAEIKQLGAALSMSELPHIELHIQSPGGALMPAFGVVDFITRNPVPVDSYIDGYAASAATLISVSCARRYAYANSLMMLHQLSASASGKFAEVQEQLANMDLFMAMIRKIYETRTVMNVSEIDEVLANDEWFSAEVCLEKGIVDAIL